jgi:regulator of sigma E protease
MLVQVLQLLLALSILIILHEWGHFYAARLFKTRVEKFYLFFDFLFPFPGIANFSLFKKKIGDTEYGIGWFPFGGYVKIAGMLDESMDEKSMSGPPQPWEYRSKPHWQRLIMIMGGIIVNFVLGIFIFWIILSVWGENSLPTKNLTYGISCDSTSKANGFQNGDVPISYNGEPITDFLDIYKKILLNSGHSMRVLRGGKEVEVPVTEDFVRDIIAIQNPKGFISARIPFVVDTTNPGSVASILGFKRGDSIIAINGKQVQFFDEFREQMLANKNKAIEITFLRNNDSMTVKTVVPSTAVLGISPYMTNRFLKFERIDYNVFSAFPAAFGRTWSTLTDYVLQFKLIFNEKIQGYKKVGGFAAMANAFPQSFDLEYFLTIMAVFSVSLAFMNFLPIPMLDGGYVIFILIEMVTGKELPARLIGYLNLIGMVLILGLMIFANLNDHVNLW